MAALPDSTSSIRARDDVGVHVAVGDVTPDGGVETATREFGVVSGKQIVDLFERHDHVGGGLLDPRIARMLRAADALR